MTRMCRQRNRRGKSTLEPAAERSEMEKVLRVSLIDGLAEMLHAEHQLAAALNRMAGAARSEALRDALMEEVRETENHVARIEQVFNAIEEESRIKPCAGMKRILQETYAIGGEAGDPAVLDARIILAGCKAKYYEITTYGNLIEWAGQLQRAEAVQLLEESLTEEKAGEERLMQIGILEATESGRQRKASEREYAAGAAPAGSSNSVTGAVQPPTAPWQS